MFKTVTNCYWIMFFRPTLVAHVFFYHMFFIMVQARCVVKIVMTLIQLFVKYNALGIYPPDQTQGNFWAVLTLKTEYILDIMNWTAELRASHLQSFLNADLVSNKSMTYLYSACDTL